MTVALAIISAVAVQRLLETVYAARNTRTLLARGGIEVGRGHYPLIVALHAGWLVSLVLALPPDPPLHVVPLVVFVFLQGARIWVINTLGPYWTTRIITVRDAPLVRRGPYRLMRHPNYLVVAGEIAALPLVFGEVRVALVFSALNAAMLTWRIREENRALADRK